MEDQAKTFASLRNEASNPLVKLYYEVLNRFHPHDYDAAINAMSGDLRSIIEACNAGFYYLEQTKTITMQHVTAQTATALRDAGFPQPEPCTGQFWFGGILGRVFIVCHRTDSGERLMGAPISAIDWSHHFEATPLLSSSDKSVFLPTAPDILRELGEAYSLTTCGPFFRVEQMKADEYFVVAYWQDENPAEACAKAWLEKNKPVSS